jgi:putative ABC transport system permease protein
MRAREDVRYAIRQLRRKPGFAITAILTLALGIGATTAVFSVVDATLLRPLPFPEPDRIIVPETRSQSGYTQPASYVGYKDERAQLHSFSAFAAYDTVGINFESPHGAVALHAVRGSDNFFDVLGVHPLLGRTFRPGEDQPGRNDLVLLSHEIWQREFSANPAVIGQVARLDGRPYTIIGVMPAGFRFPLGQRNAIYTPLHVSPTEVTRRGSHWLPTMGRLSPGVTREQAQADFSRVLTDLGRAYPETDAGCTVILHTLAAGLSDGVRTPLEVTFGAVLSVLALCCVNIAGLLLARGVSRQREMAMRAAVGASQATLVRQMLTESLVLAVLGGVSGVLLCLAILKGMSVFLLNALPRGGDISMDLRVLVVALLLSTLASVLAAALPAIRLARTDPSDALRSGGAGTGTSRAQHRLRFSFVVTQVALAITLLFTAGLLVRAIHERSHVPLGFDADRILSTEIDLSPARYENRDPMDNLYQPLVARLEHMPGIAAAGLINITPIQSWGSNSDIHIKGQPTPPPNQEVLGENRFVTPGYFRTFGIHAIRGRMLDPGLDGPKGPLRIVVNEAFVRKFFAHGGDPIGATIDNWHDATIIGVVSDVRQDLGQPPMAEMDLLASSVPPEYKMATLRTMQLVVRTAGDPHTAYASVRDVLHQVDPTVPFRTPETMGEIVLDELRFERMESWLFGGFAVLALMLAVVGIYGLLSHEVEQGRRDIGIRMALGATRALVLRVVATRAAAMVTAGLAAGALLTFLANRAIAALLPYSSGVRTENFNGAGTQLFVFAAMSICLFLISLLAALLPARRAATIEPMTALRME